ncbi:ATP-binding cassette domain-containing protein [Novosphingobium sp. FSY-8]|uniref:ATP-binding cassette domain-containing protein n=2 Tax=Novosphingobium ovatum TaxID=1908523 RepID=A0ABW9XEC8_9SPHN|nr:ATP-binding cassette domain-containing protein [Novosphingobium ovatum]
MGLFGAPAIPQLGLSTLCLRDVWKSYPTKRGANPVLRGVNLELRRGEKIAILGGNGAGKSTLIRIAGGIERPNRGYVHLGLRVSWPLAFSGAFQGSLTGWDNARFICRVHGQDFATAQDFIADFSALGRYLDEPVKSYSSGMRARLAFAVSMMIEFDVYLLDEVFAVGDARFQARCHEELFVRRADRAFLIVSHDAGYVRDHCDRAAVLRDGTLTEYACVAEAQDAHHAHMAAPITT